MGFEPTHGDRIGLAVQRLNHSATLSCVEVLVLCVALLQCFFSFSLIQWKTVSCSSWLFQQSISFTTFIEHRITHLNEKSFRQRWDSNPRTETVFGLAVQRLNHSATLSYVELSVLCVASLRCVALFFVDLMQKLFLVRRGFSSSFLHYLYRRTPNNTS